MTVVAAAAQPTVEQRGAHAEVAFRPRQGKATTENALGETRPAARGMPRQGECNRIQRRKPIKQSSRYELAGRPACFSSRSVMASKAARRAASTERKPSPQRLISVAPIARTSKRHAAAPASMRVM